MNLFIFNLQVHCVADGGYLFAPENPAELAIMKAIGNFYCKYQFCF